MPNTNPTIVSASLSDKELQDSINKMVANFDKGLQTMLEHSNEYVGKIQESLQKIGNTNFGAKGSNDGGVAKRTKAQNAETDAVEKNIAARGKQIKQNQDVATSFDNMAAAQQKAIAPKSARDSFYAFAQGYKQQAQEIAQYIQSFESGLNRVIQNRLNELNTQLSASKEKIRKLNEELNRRNFASGNPQAQAQVQAQLDKELKTHNQIQKAIANVNNEYAFEKTYLASLYAEHHRISNIMRDETTINNKVAQSQQEVVQATRQTAQAQRNSANATNQTKQSLDALNAAVAQNTRKEDERRIAIIRSGQAAQESLTRIKQNAQIELAENTGKPIGGLKELTAAIREMERAYWDMSSYGKESPIGQSLKADIEYAKKLRTAIEAYNRTLGGFSVIGNKNGANNTLGSYSELSMLLKTLADDYKRLGREERNAAKGNDLADKIQRIGRATQKIQQQMNRPISFAAAMKGDEKTLDDIAYKMQRLRSYRQGIDLTKPNAANEIRQVDEALAKLQKDADKWMSKSQEMIKNNTALGRSWNYMKNRLAFYFTVGASTQFVKNLIEVRSQYEMNERALGILIDSAERGTQIFNELSQMALVSPYTLIELSAAAKQLTAYDIAARDVVDTTRRLADMASAVGVPIERLTYALGQIKAYGYLNSRDARMFANAGIPLVKQLSDYYTELEGKMVSTADVYDRMKKKAIDYNSVMAVVTKMTDEGGKFFDFQAKMADTLKVRLANLTLAWNNMLNDMGKESQGVLTWGIGALRDLFLQWKNLYGALNEVALVFGVAKALQFLGVCAHAAGIGFGSLNKYMTLNALLGTRLATTVRTLGSAFMSLVHSPLAWLTMAALLATEIADAFTNADRATKEFNESLRDSAKTTYEDLKKFAEQYKNIRDSLYTTQKTAIGNIYDPSTGKAAATAYANQTVGQEISASEAKKVWEAMREQIELSSHASDEYISKLLSIENVSERLRQGFQILDDIQTVSAALKEIGEDGIKVTQGWAAWWNAWQGADGLIGNVKDLQKEIQRLKDAGQNPNDEFTKVIDKDYATALERFRNDLKVTTDSVLDFINLNGWSGDIRKIDEVFKQVTDRIATQSNLDPQAAFTLQREVEIARAKAAKEALEIRIADEKKALATASDEISKQQIQKNLETLEQQKRDFDKFNGENRAYWNDFTKYIKERHISELTAAYNSMTDHGKKAMDFQSEEWQKRVHDWANRYEKSHNLAIDSVFNRLRNWINDANTWSVFIKMTISTEDGKSVYKQLEEYDKAADDAWKTMQRLDKRISQLRKKGAKELKETNSEYLNGALDVSSVSENDKELTEALKERTQAQKDYNDAIAKGGESKKENSAASKAQKAAESELAKALKDELKLIETVRSSYKDLTKEGASHADAVKKSVSGYEKSVANINAVLNKYGIGLDLSKFAGISNPHELQKMLREQLNTLVGKAKPTEIQALEVELKKVDLDVDKYDLTKITKGLNSELDRLKEEYELAVSLDADPELGSIFADWMGIDMDNLPRTAEEYAKRYTDILNKKMKERKADIELPNLLNITDDDLRELQNRVGTGGITQTYVDEITKAVKDVRGVFKKEKEDTSKEWNALIEKYGGLQAKILQIYKNNVQQQASIVKQFGSDEQISQALDLVRKIQISQDPAEIARLQEELAKVLNDVTKNNPIALKTYQATQKEQSSLTSKAMWDDFKDSDLYSMTFTDMANNSTQAIQLIIDKLNTLKDKVKEDPASMKALIKSLEDAENELNSRDPFRGISSSINTWIKATREQKEAQEELELANKEVAGSEIALKNAQSVGDKKAIVKAEQQLAQAQQKQATAQGKVVQSGNKAKKAQEQLKTSFQNLSNELGNVSGLLGSVSKIFRAVGDDDTADAIDAINEGFTIMTTVIMGVTAALIILESSNPWLLAMAAALSVIVGLVSFLSGNSNKKITEQVEESERAVKRLELAYIDLEHAVNEAYGMATIGANMAAKANKELQLVELKRQLALERSRDSKHRDEDKIIDLQKQIKELEYEIEDAVDNIVNDLLGISSVGDAMENMMDAFIDALRSGEDAMETFDENVDEMIAKMVKKMYVTKILQPWFEEQWNKMQEQINQRAGDIPEKIAKIQSKTSIAKSADTTDNNSLVEALRALGMSDDQIHILNWYNEFGRYDFGLGRNARLKAAYEKMLKEAEQKEAELQKELTTATMPTTDDIRQYAELLRSGQPIMEENMQEVANFLRELGLMKDDASKNLSALQQGLQSMSETTAESIEAYMNGVSQQVYYHSSLLEQIRDSVVGLNLDVSLGVQSQILLQLQNSYQTQQAIQQILEGVLNPSGRAFSVELVS